MSRLPETELCCIVMKHWQLDIEEGCLEMSRVVQLLKELPCRTAVVGVLDEDSVGAVRGDGAVGWAAVLEGELHVLHHGTVQVLCDE